MKLLNRMTFAGWVLIVAGAFVVAGCGSSEEEEETATGLATGGEEEAAAGGETAAEGEETAAEGEETAAEGEETAAEGEETAAEGEEEAAAGGEEEAAAGGEEEAAAGGEEEAAAGGEEEAAAGGEEEEEEEEEEEVTIELPETCGDEGGIVCPAAPESSTEVAVEQVAEGAPEAFVGGDVPAGAYELTKVVLYPGSMTENQTSLPVEISVKNNGSNGSAIFDGDAWGIQANLDVEIDALGNIVPLQENLQGGGCFASEGVTLAGDVTQCSEESSEDSEFTLPNSFDYNNDGAVVQLLLKFPVDALLAGLADQPAIANVLGALLVNDLQVVLEMEAVE